MLDPEDPSTLDDWTPPGALDQRIQDFGRFPNFRVLLPGDLMLSSPIQPARFSKHVLRWQERQYAPKHSRWTHAAIYIGDEWICEAVNPVVRAVRIDPYVGGHLLRFRRDPLLTPDDRFRLVRAGLMRCGERYSIGDVSIQFSPKLPSWEFRISPVGPHSLICATLYRDAHDAACPRRLQVPVGERSFTICPAFLSLTTHLRDVEVRWLKIV